MCWSSIAPNGTAVDISAAPPGLRGIGNPRRQSAIAGSSTAYTASFAAQRIARHRDSQRDRAARRREPGPSPCGGQGTGPRNSDSRQFDRRRGALHLRSTAAAFADTAQHGRDSLLPRTRVSVSPGQSIDVSSDRAPPTRRASRCRGFTDRGIWRDRLVRRRPPRSRRPGGHRSGPLLWISRQSSTRQRALHADRYWHQRQPSHSATHDAWHLFCPRTSPYSVSQPVNRRPPIERRLHGEHTGVGDSPGLGI